jgi:hypothetical protein
MTSEQYNQAIINFYSNTFLQLSLKSNALKIDIHQKAKELTDNFSINFNNYVAKDFLDKLENQNASIHDKLKNYPEQFWLTVPGAEYFESIQNNITHDMTFIILSAMKNNEKVDIHMFSSTVDNLITIYQQDLKAGKKQLVKLKNELSSNKLFDTQENLLLLLGESINKNKKTDKILKQIKEDFVSLVGFTSKGEIF